MLLQSVEEEVWPAVVAVVVAGAAVGDAVAYEGYGGVGGWLPGFERGEEVPVEGLLGGWGGDVQASGEVGGRDVRGCP